MLGYCAVCEKLVPIKPGGFKWAGSREKIYYPVSHDTLAGKPCPGDKKGL